MNEFKRKLFHLTGILYLIAYIKLSYTHFIVTMAALSLITFIVEVLRLKNEKINNITKKIFSGIIRKKEERAFSGILFTFLGCLFTGLIAGDNKTIGIVALSFSLFADTVAALTGTYLGKYVITNGKTVEGTFSFFLVCLFICYIFLDSFKAAVYVAVSATLIEFLPLPYSDNLWVPFLTATLIKIL